jgi:hypothetical protein
MAARVEDFARRRAMRPGSMKALAKLAEARPRIRRKPRTDEQQRMLRRMALVAVDQRRESGRMERVGPREYVVHVVAPRQVR